MQQIPLEQVIRHVGELLKDEKDNTDVGQILIPALNQFPDNAALWFYFGFWQNKIGNHALAVVAWEKSFALEPQALVLANLGASARETGAIEFSRGVLAKADFLRPDDVAVLTNFAGTYVNEGNPWPGIEAARKAVEISGGKDNQAAFNLALLELEAGHFAEGFKLYASGHHPMRDAREYRGAERLTPENFEQAKGKRLLVYGEQGIGDELMFSSLFEHATTDFGKVIFDHHPRLGGLYSTLPWAHLIELHPTRKVKDRDWYEPGCADYYTPIGNLAQFYRRTLEDFTWHGPLYKANQEEVDLTRRYLRELSEGRHVVALAFRGGTLKTARTYRAIEPKLLEPLLSRDDLMFINVDYEDMTGPVGWISEHFGQDKCLWYPSIAWAWDYHHLGAMLAACDAVVSVCQSAAHLAAAMGLKTHVLTPSRAAWRYGIGRTNPEDPITEREPWYWYPSGKAIIHRQRGNDWTPTIHQVAEELAWE